MSIYLKRIAAFCFSLIIVFFSFGSHAAPSEAMLTERGYYELVTESELSDGHYIIYGINLDYAGALSNWLIAGKVRSMPVEIDDDGRIPAENAIQSIIWYLQVHDDGTISLFNEECGMYLEIVFNRALGYVLNEEITCGYSVTFDPSQNSFRLKTTSADGGNRCISLLANYFRAAEYDVAEDVYLYKFVPEPTEGGLIGDIDGDELITANDALLILRHVLQIEFLDDQQLLNADINSDGIIATDDALLALHWVLSA